MDQIKSLVKKNDVATMEKPFVIDLKRLDSYSFDKLKEFIIKYEKFNEKNVAEVLKVRRENAQLSDDIEQLDDQMKDICNVNIDLNNQLMENDNKIQFSELLQISLLKAVETLGCQQFVSLTSATQDLHNAINDFTLTINTQRNNIIGQNESSGDLKEKIDQFTLHFENLVIDLGQKFTVISSGSETIQGYYTKLIQDIKGLYYNLAEHDEENILEKFMMNDLVICSKKKLSSNGRAIAGIKKDLTVLKSEHTAVLKNLEKHQKENFLLKNRNQELEYKSSELKQSLDSIVQVRNVNDNEISSHLETLKILQQENYSLNMALQESRSRTLENDKILLNLRKEKQQLNERLSDSDSRNISALRQERLKLDQSKRDCEQLEQKLKDTETMLKSENLKYESLYKKYKDLKEVHKKTLENNDALRKVAKSFDGNQGEKTLKVGAVNKNSELLSSLNESENTKTKTTDYGNSRQRGNINYEQLANEIEDLKLTVVTSEVRIATERRVFDELTREKSEALEESKMVM
jgi:hypothetical protein